MKAIVYNKYGSREELEMAELPLPSPGRDEVLVRPVAISMNPRDIAIRQGALKFLSGSKFPKLTGSDVSGIVEAVGSGVNRFRKGDAVFGYAQGLKTGMSAEYITLPQKYLTFKPDGIDHASAATLGCAYLTALQGLRDKANLKPGQEVLVYGASGGVGTAVMQLAKSFGAKVTAVSNSRNEAYCREQGADEFIAYDKGDPFEGDRKYDVFFQVFSKQGVYYGKAKQILKRSGTYITLIPNPLFAIRYLFAKPRFRFIMVKTRIPELDFLAERVESGNLKPHISVELPLEEMKEAHRLVETSHVVGKVVVKFKV